MKKISIILVVLFLASAVSAFATDYTSSGTTLSVSAQTSTPQTPAWSVELSKNVAMKYRGHSTGLYYSVGSYHNSGDKIYGTTCNDTKIYYKNETGFDNLPAAPTNTGTTFSGWLTL